MWLQERRRHVVLHIACTAALSLLAACAGPMKPLEFAAPIRLQDPLPGHMVAYFIRAPHDATDITIAVNDAPAAMLPASTFTSVQFEPGTHRLTALARGTFDRGESAAPVELVAKAGERRFFYISQPRTTQYTLALVPVKSVILLPLANRSSVPAGQRQWAEVDESDAQGLLSIASVVRPLQDSFSPYPGPSSLQVQP